MLCCAGLGWAGMGLFYIYPAPPHRGGHHKMQYQYKATGRSVPFNLSGGVFFFWCNGKLRVLFFKMANWF